MFFGQQLEFVLHLEQDVLLVMQQVLQLQLVQLVGQIIPSTLEFVLLAEVQQLLQLIKSPGHQLQTVLLAPPQLLQQPIY